MNKKIVISLVIILVISIFLIFSYLNNKEDIYNPVVDYDDDVIWEDIEKTYITFNGTNISDDSNGYIISNNILTIKSGGSYYLSGNYDGYIIVDSSSEVYLVLDNLTINSSSNPAIFIKNAKKTVINLEDDSINYLIDNNTNIDENATIYSKDDLVIMGTGILNIEANNHAISCKDTLQIIDGSFNISANNDAIRAKDYLAIKSGNFDIKTFSDGIKATNDEDESLGYLIIDGGTFNINVSNDAIQAITNLTINDGIFNITTTGNEDNSSKGIKCNDIITINGGNFVLDTYDDSIHSNNAVYINSGNFTIKSGDDGIHADYNLKIENGNINIIESYEGLEATEITINDGIIYLVSTDDGINAAGGNDSSSMSGGFGRPKDVFSSSNGKLYINGGYIYVDAKGDGIDINGSGVMNGGTVIVNGPTTNGNGALDYDGTFNVNGGLLIAAGSSGMSQSPSNSSSQYTLAINFTTNLNSVVCIKSSGKDVISFKPSKSFQSLIISSSSLSKNESYDIYTDCTTTKEGKDGIYENSLEGNLYKTVTISSIVTNVGTQSAMIPGRR